jgi:glutamate-ammonia-ligase adenylyltransferase
VPLTPERLRELIRMKRRIETERVQPSQVHRNVKLGSGGLNDIEWTVRLTEMRFPSATRAMSTSDSRERIQNLGHSGLFNTVEVEQLLEARELLLSLRTWLTLQGHKDDLIPENPDRLQRLAESAGFSSGNELLQRVGSITHVVRGLFEDTLERLRA